MNIRFQNKSVWLDNVRLTSKEKIIDAIFKYLNYIGYSFSMTNPCPAFLRNYRDMDMKFLVNFFHNLWNQTFDMSENEKRVLPLCCLTKNGLSLFDENRCVYHRVFRVEYRDFNGTKIDTFISSPNLVFSLERLQSLNIAPIIIS